MKPIITLALLPTAVSNMLNTPKPTLNPQVLKADTQTATYVDMNLQFLADYDASYTNEEQELIQIDAYGETRTISNDICTITYTYANQVYETDYYNEISDIGYKQQWLYIKFEITPYITKNIKHIEVANYNNDEMEWYYNPTGPMPNYKIANSILQYEPTNPNYMGDGDLLDYQFPQSKTTTIGLKIHTENSDGIDQQLYPDTSRRIRIFYQQDENIVINTDPVNLPGLLWEIIAMPFAFITQAFNLTLFPGTPYAINIANTIMVFLGILILLAILKIVLKIFL